MLGFFSGSSVVEEDLDYTHPCITFCVHDLSHDYLRGDRGVIIPEQGKYDCVLSNLFVYRHFGENSLFSEMAAGNSVKFVNNTS